jgi:hypothetical protein
MKSIAIVYFSVSRFIYLRPISRNQSMRRVLSMCTQCLWLACIRSGHFASHTCTQPRWAFSPSLSNKDTLLGRDYYHIHRTGHQFFCRRTSSWLTSSVSGFCSSRRRTCRSSLARLRMSTTSLTIYGMRPTICSI